jgi:hypothetical protein
MAQLTKDIMGGKNPDLLPDHYIQQQFNWIICNTQIRPLLLTKLMLEFGVVALQSVQQER